MWPCIWKHLSHSRCENFRAFQVRSDFRNSSKHWRWFWSQQIIIIAFYWASTLQRGTCERLQCPFHILSCSPFWTRGHYAANLLVVKRVVTTLGHWDTSRCLLPPGGTWEAGCWFHTLSLDSPANMVIQCWVLKPQDRSSLDPWVPLELRALLNHMKIYLHQKHTLLVLVFQTSRFGLFHQVAVTLIDTATISVVRFI